MSTVKTNIADYLAQIEKLTNTNLQILQTINDSFFTKKNHLFTKIDDATYVVPSFISLENKINMLQENFENLVKAPETSEAYFNFDGNTRAIEVRKYSHVPDSVTLPIVTKFEYANNDIFKDFMTPVPYINLEIPEIPNDITEVNVKKIIPRSNDLKDVFKSKLSAHSSNVSYADIKKTLLNYIEDVDYIEYDTIYKMPLRKNIGTSTYIIEKVISDVITDDLDELITLKLRNDYINESYNNKLTYKLFDDTIEKQLNVGDQLINFDGTGKVEIREIKPAQNIIVVKVLNGEYLNFLGTESYDTNNDTDIHDFSKLRFYSSIDFDKDKYVKVPIENDQYVFVAIAPINSRMNLQSSWGIGLIIDTYMLKDINGFKSFKSYYDENVKNIGDVLFEITSMITSPVFKLTPNEFSELTKIKPEINLKDLTVVQINKHLNNSTTVKNIRDAYNQKKNTENELNEIQKKISDINNQLSEISFEDTSGIRTLYLSQLSDLNTKKNELITTINTAMNDIAMNANSAEIPIENAKYRIRGFYIPNIGENYNDHVIGIKVQYRYKNTSSETGNALSISGSNSDSMIYSDWNNLNTFNKSKIAKCVDDVFLYSYEESNESKNEPSYNQIDIPISQGESVDIRLKVLYDYGQPYVNITSDWSEICNIKFPEEYAKDLPILTIIEENNNDIESNRFNNILKTSGVTEHINDIIIDQNITYYHKPDSIASGFYTEERRIIPLKDKLETMSNDIALLKNEITDVSNNCKISLILGDTNNILYSDRDNNITLEPYSSFVTTNESEYNNAYTFDNGLVSTVINIAITNVGDTAMKLYSIFPGNRDTLINNSTSTYVSKDQYSNGENEGVWFKYKSNSNDVKLQTQNQFITFRIKDVWSGVDYYMKGAGVSMQNTQNSSEISSIGENDELGMIIYPYVSTEHGLCIDSDNVKSYLVINPGQEIIIPMMCTYIASKPNTLIQKTISFDIRTSLYNDPINYTFNVIGKNTTTMQDKLSSANNRNFWDRLTKGNKYNSTIK